MFTEKDVQYVAKLSRIHINEKEISSLSKDLEKILEYVNKLEELDITDIDPTSHVVQLKNVYREDVIKSSLSQEDALKTSVESLNGAFKVPKIIE